MDINVKKREGEVEPWSYDKLVASIGKAGVPEREAEQVAGAVQSWVLTNAESGVVSSTAVRDKVIEEMKKSYPSEADTYQAYKKG